MCSFRKPSLINSSRLVSNIVSRSNSSNRYPKQMTVARQPKHPALKVQKPSTWFQLECDSMQSMKFRRRYRWCRRVGQTSGSPFRLHGGCCRCRRCRLRALLSSLLGSTRSVHLVPHSSPLQKRIKMCMNRMAVIAVMVGGGTKTVVSWCGACLCLNRRTE